MEKFNTCIDQCGVLDLKMFGGNMISTNGQNGRNGKWALVNLPFLQHLTSARLEYMARKSFDHKPMILSFSSQTRRYGPTPFKYQNMWSTHNNFIILLRQVLMEPVHGLVLNRLAAKLKKE